jgi:hypothetical protein
VAWGMRGKVTGGWRPRLSSIAAMRLKRASGANPLDSTIVAPQTAGDVAVARPSANSWNPSRGCGIAKFCRILELFLSCPA